MEVNVYDAAIQRLHYIIDHFDSIAVMFSGGKDSLALLHLFEQVWRDTGHEEKVNVVFRDEELIPDDVIQFVTYYYKSGRYNFYYYAVPLQSYKFILGKTTEYVQWDPNREWVRQKPDFAITEPHEVLSQYTMDEVVGRNFKGRTAFLTGIRASESLIRFKSIMNKRNLPFLAGNGRIQLGRPIYDWSERDVFKFLFDNRIRYCAIYDNQLWNGTPLRVSTPLHMETAKRFHQLKTLYPMFYQQIINVFPEMILQDKYYKDVDRLASIKKYPRTWSGIILFIKDNIPDADSQALAIKRVIEAKNLREGAIRDGKGGRFGGYPLLYVFKTIAGGGFKRVLNNKGSKVTAEEIAYERGN